jgi:hypothetical protein
MSGWIVTKTEGDFIETWAAAVSDKEDATAAVAEADPQPMARTSYEPTRAVSQKELTAWSVSSGCVKRIQ